MTAEVQSTCSSSLERQSRGSGMHPPRVPGERVSHLGTLGWVSPPAATDGRVRGTGLTGENSAFIVLLTRPATDDSSQEAQIREK